MLELRDLTVGQVSGMIAAAVFVVQILIPITLPLILLGLIKLRSSTVTQTAVSWSVIGRLLHSSWWPVLLGTDSAQTLSAGGPPLFISLFRAFAVILIGVSAIVTPLGLYEGIVADAEPSAQLFHYVPDRSTMGLGTAPRTNTTWSRICGGFGPYPCPNSNSNISYFTNLTGEYVSGDWYDSRVLPRTIDVLQSGLKNFESTVSGPFDIQYRMYQQQSINDNERAIPVDNLTAYTVGSYMPLSTLVMADDILVVEGLIVDMKNGGIGFRNHSAPAWRQFGSTWEEDILFIEPDTVCVDTNLTLTFIVPRFSSEESSASSGVYKLTLVDEGGFVNLNQTYPAWTPGDTQTDPVLQFRAYKAAWLNNAFSMAFMNVTNLNNKTTGQKSFSYLNSTVGKKFPLYYPDGESGNSLSIKPSALQIGQYGGVVSGLDTGVSNISTIGNSTEEYNFPSKEPIYANPFGVTDANFSSASLVCQGAGGADLANITNQMAECGMLYGAPRRTDGSDSMLFDPGSEWTISMYSCMSTVKATIKRVSFRFNGTLDDASSLKVVSLADKEYPNEESKPLWAAENTNMSLRDGGPLWGIVDPDRAQDLNLSTFRSERFYLPGYVGLSSVGFENLPSIDFPRYALSQIYHPLGISGVDYTGATNLAMYRQWRELSKEAGSAAKILNLMWTDIAANLVVGTKSLDPESQTSNGESNTNIKKRAAEGSNNQNGPAITGYERRVRYKLPYGIPAFLALAVTAFTVIPSIFFVFSTARPSQMKQVLNATSAGRLLTSGGGQTSGYDTSYGGQGQMVNRSYGGDASTKDWVQSVGKAPFTLGPEGWSKNMQPAQSGTPYATYGDGKNGPAANYAPVPGGQY